MSEKAWAIDEVEQLNLSSHPRKNPPGTMPSDSLNSNGDAIAQTTCMLSRDVQEGVRAFLDKREPIFRGL
jgi:hypothetical protein